MTSNANSQNVAVLTTARSEYYHLLSVLRGIQSIPSFNLQVFVSGMHLSERFGMTEKAISADGWPHVVRIPIFPDEDTATACAIAAGRAVQGVGEALVKNKTDLLVAIGDRYEMLAGVFGAVCAGVPVAHLYGGDRTDGAMDDICRHAMTKLSNIHFVIDEVYAARVRQMGEHEDRVFIVGAPFVDEMLSRKPLSKEELSQELGFPLAPPVALVTYHPATREDADDRVICDAMFGALKRNAGTIVVTAPNNDPGHGTVLSAIDTLTKETPKAHFIKSLGSRRYHSMLANADLMVGNSSSGIHEAPTFKLPVVNIGSRQASRLHPANVIDCGHLERDICEAIEKALSPSFKQGMQHLINPFGDGRTGRLVAEKLRELAPFRKLLLKTFADGTEIAEATRRWQNKYGSRNGSPALK